MTRARTLAIGALVLAVGAGVIGVRASGRPGPRTQPAADTARTADVTVAPAAAGDLALRVSAAGSVTSLRDAKIGSKTTGRVATVLVEEGQHVRAGQPLLRLDTDELAAGEAQARADVAAARARLAQLRAGARPEERRQASDSEARAQWALRLAQANAERMRTLYSQGAVSKQELDTAETQAAQARMEHDWSQQGRRIVEAGPRAEEIQVAQAQLVQAESALAAARVRLADATIAAPFDGTVLARSVEPGDTLSVTSSPAFVISQIDRVYVELAVPERHRSVLRAGQPAAVRIDGLPGRTFAGTVSDIRPAAGAANRVFGVKILVPNPDGTLRPGMFAQGTIVLAIRRGVVQVPESAVVTTTSGPMLFVVRDGRAVRRPVTLGERQDGRVEIASGIAAGDPVVVLGQEALADGQSVTVRARQP